MNVNQHEFSKIISAFALYYKQSFLVLPKVANDKDVSNVRFPF